MVILRRPRANESVERLAMLKARCIGSEARITRQFRLTHHGSQGCELLVVLDGDGTPLIFTTACIDVMGREETRGIAIALLDRAVHGIFDHGGIGERNSRQRLSQVDPLALSCTPGGAQ